jgi:uncharacterized protein YndB with AHSA1/START domain
MEGHVGGRIVERIRGGRQCVWGTVTAWDPPRRVAFTWHPGQEVATAGDVEVRFAPDGAHTRVVLHHTGFERLGGAMAGRARRAYSLGWIYVLGLYGRKRGPVMVGLTALTALMVAVVRRKERRKAVATAQRV